MYEPYSHLYIYRDISLPPLPPEACSEVVHLYNANNLEKLSFKYEKTFWDNFLQIKNSSFCICLLCGKRYTCYPANGKAVKNHVLMNYADTYKEVNRIDNRDIHSRLFKFMTISNISSTILDSNSFRFFCSALNYTPPRREKYNEFLEENYKSVNVYYTICICRIP